LKRLCPRIFDALLTGGYCNYILVVNNWDPMVFVIVDSQFDLANGVIDMEHDG